MCSLKFIIAWGVLKDNIVYYDHLYHNCDLLCGMVHMLSCTYLLYMSVIKDCHVLLFQWWGEGISSRSGKSQGLSFLVREIWEFNKKSGNSVLGFNFRYHGYQMGDQGRLHRSLEVMSVRLFREKLPEVKEKSGNSLAQTCGSPVML